VSVTLSHGSLSTMIKKRKKNMKTKLTLAIMASVLLVAAQARASLFDITFTSNDGSTVGSGWVTGTPEGGGVYAATGGAFQITGGAFSQSSYSLIPNPSAPNASYSPLGSFMYDNQVLTGQNPFLSNSGLLFGDETVPIEINLFSNGPSSPVPAGTYQLYQNNGVNLYGNATLTAVPEPTTIISGALLLLPFGASTLRILRRNRTA
jgi:hypothetical protein